MLTNYYTKNCVRARARAFARSKLKASVNKPVRKLKLFHGIGAYFMSANVTLMDQNTEHIYRSFQFSDFAF